jgi:hypothetical protein
MNERLQKKRNEHGSSVFPFDIVPAVWVVLSEDFRDELFEGTYQQCEQFLRSSCSTGMCEG